MYTLGIESTCDETGCAVVRDGRHILSNVVSSQIDLHTLYGGVVPELACRRHVDVFLPVLEESLAKAALTIEQIDLIAVAQGPGLVGALLIGVTAAKALAYARGIPFVGVNHTEAHLYAALMEHPEPISFPCLGVVLSGGHTLLLEMHAPTRYTLLGTTQDDAIGEAFDKVAKILGLPYPGGPQIEALARSGDPFVYPFRAGQVKANPRDFSFSGLKTAVLYATQKQSLTPQQRADVAASFQYAAFNDVIEKINRLPRYDTLLFGGGVTNNKLLRHMCREAFPDRQLVWPSPSLTLDNAAMIAGLGHHIYALKGAGDPLDLEAFPRQIA